MTIKKIVQRLRSDGVRVTLKKRTDGGYIVSSINGKKYTGKSGNAVARGLLNQPLTHRQEVQRRASLAKSREVAERARVAKEKYGIIPNRTPTKTTKHLRSLITKANKALRTKTKASHRVSMRKVKEALRRGESSASIASRLQETIRHAEGQAYKAEREFWISYFDKKKVKSISKILRRMGDSLTSSQTGAIRQAVYHSHTRQEVLQSILDMFYKSGELSTAEYNTLVNQIVA